MLDEEEDETVGTQIFPTQVFPEGHGCVPSH